MLLERGVGGRPGAGVLEKEKAVVVGVGRGGGRGRGFVTDFDVVFKYILNCICLQQSNNLLPFNFTLILHYICNAF